MLGRRAALETARSYLFRPAEVRPDSTGTLPIGQRLGEAGDREIRRRCAIDDRRNDARRQEGAVKEAQLGTASH
jgi:hypothetical protein